MSSKIRTTCGENQVELVPFNPMGPTSVLLFPLLDTGETVIVPGDQALHERGGNVGLLRQDRSLPAWPQWTPALPVTRRENLGHELSFLVCKTGIHVNSPSVASRVS